jgi:hypothetical protein
VRQTDTSQGTFVAADETGQRWTQHREDIEHLLTNLDRSLEWLRRSKSRESVTLIADLQDVADEVRGAIEVPGAHACPKSAMGGKADIKALAPSRCHRVIR